MKPVDAKLLVVAVSMLLLPRSVSAIGLSYSDNQVFAHGYIDMQSAGPLVLPDYPFAETGKKLFFQTSYRQLYEIRELTDSRVALAVSRGDFTLGAGAALFGEPDYFQQLGLSLISSFRSDAVAFGVSAVYHRYSFGRKYDALSFIMINPGFSYRRDEVQLFAVGRTVNQPAYYSGSGKLPPQAEVGMSVKSRGGLDNQFKVLFIRRRRPTAELSQSFALGKYAGVNWALILRPARFGAGLQLEKGHFGFDYKFSHHPVLGWTHTVALSIFCRS